MNSEKKEKILPNRKKKLKTLLSQLSCEVKMKIIEKKLGKFAAIMIKFTDSVFFLKNITEKETRSFFFLK